MLGSKACVYMQACVWVHVQTCVQACTQMGGCAVCMYIVHLQYVYCYFRNAVCVNKIVLVDCI